MSKAYLALLRGINVGGKNKLPMKDLAAIFVAAGCKDVRTHIQSGNVIFGAPARALARLPGLVAAKIEEQFGYRVPVVLRTAAEIRETMASNPFLAEGSPEDMLHVLFLADRPDPSAILGLDPDRGAPDSFVVRGNEIYLRLPNGVARSKLTNAYFDSKLETISTGRNWRTLTVLHERLAEI
jgi:uncharacterized protein (DUF1697 family)